MATGLSEREDGASPAGGEATETFHFSLGNSTVGPIGFCASVTARSREEAVRILQESLPTELPLVRNGEVAGIEYARVYLNPESVGIEDIDFVE